MIGEYILLTKVRRKLLEDRMEQVAVFVYFLLITGFDGLQLVVLQISPASPTNYTPISAWGSAFIGLGFILLSFFLNGGARGKRFLDRYFSICAVVGIWCILPFQVLLAVPTYLGIFAELSWYIPV